MPLKVLDVELPNAYRRYPPSKRFVVGVDCESMVDGYAFLVCDSRGRHAWIRSFDDVLAFFDFDDYRYAMLVFFNMNFDVSVLLKWMGKELCEELVNKGRVSLPTCSIEYVHGKYTQMRFGNRFVRMFDVAQFFQGTLDYNAKQYLGRAKKVVKDKAFTKADYGRIKLVEYCEWDAVLAEGLGKYVVEAFARLGVDVWSLASPAAILESYVVDQQLIRNPVHSVPKSALEMAMLSFDGAWFENFKAGTFPRTFRYDMVSAYPYVIRDLADLSLGRWVEGVTRPAKALYGRLYGKVTVPKTHISPIMFRNAQGDVLHPHGTWPRVITMQEYDWLLAHGGSMDVEEAVWFVPFTVVRKFEGVVNKFFKVKRDAKADSMEKWSSKIALAGLWGKFLQHRGGFVGRLYNPVYASEITSRVRLMDADACMQSPESVVAVMSDCVTSVTPLKLPLGDDIGQWKGKGPTAALWIGPVQYETEELEDQDRRFRRVPWGSVLKASPGDVEYEVVRNGPLSLLQGVRQNRFEDVGVFIDVPMKFNIRKLNWRRFWPVRPSCGGDLLTTQYESRQIHVTSRLKPEDMVLWTMDS